MIKKLLILGALIAAGVTALSVWAGCGGNDNTQQVPEVNQMQTSAAASSEASDTLSKVIDDLKKADMTVEVINNGKNQGKWSQNKDGSWRWENEDKSVIVIYNAQKQKFWTINGSTAYEETQTTEAQYAAYNPVTIFSSFAYLPRTGGSNDTWEFNVPGTGKLTIEFKGPQGLPTKVVSEDHTTGETDVTEFIYTDVGSVPSSMFELPSGVTVVTSNSAGGYGSSSVTIPGGGQ